MKRFYSNVTAVSASGNWIVHLDGKPLKTQGGQPQMVPSEELAQLLAAEWEAQGDTIDPASFVHRDMADYAIDIVSDDRDAVIDKLLGYAETDTLCYRAHPGEALFRRQQEVWEPLVAGFEAREGIELQRISGIIHRPQKRASIATLRKRLATHDPFALAALEQLTGLAASLCIGLEALGQTSEDEVAELWDAANLEEDWQVEQWGHDEEAAERRAKRARQFIQGWEFARAASD